MTKKRRLKHRNSIKRHTRESRWTIKAILGKRNTEKQKKKSNPGLEERPNRKLSTLVHATIFLIWSKSDNS